MGEKKVFEKKEVGKKGLIGALSPFLQRRGMNEGVSGDSSALA